MNGVTPEKERRKPPLKIREAGEEGEEEEVDEEEEQRR